MDSLGASFVPSFLMVSAQVAFAGLNLFSKMALNTGMSPLVMLSYRQFFAAVVLAPVAYTAERTTWSTINRHILAQIFLCSLFGATLNQILYFLGLKLTNATIACALNNTLPAITFIMAACFRMESVRLRTLAGQAKVVGTLLCVGGSMLMTFYKGPLIHMSSSGMHWNYAENMDRAAASSGITEIDMAIGSALIIGSCVAWSAWFLVQSRMSKNSFASPYSTTAIMSVFAGVQCLLTAAVVERNLPSWSLGWDIRLYATLYAGVMGSGFAFAAMSYCIEARGALYVSMFSPLLLIIVAVLGWAVLDERFYAGTVEGSALIVAGLYLVLWGKSKEEKAEQARMRRQAKLDAGDHRDTPELDGIQVVVPTSAPAANSKTVDVVDNRRAGA